MGIGRKYREQILEKEHREYLERIIHEEDSEWIRELSEYPGEMHKEPGAGKVIFWSALLTVSLLGLISYLIIKYVL